ncbi:sigma 54-interacting transcriptional regulator [Vagococcus coleopterorum]|uniref:sigma 54-interacting transcriptional regulator n=1 Tax=Vagococcus coleopterorum TaxID=2714946 RepID=UPI001EE9BC13|nr:sigma-54-dependent transcriptional regulator [Vagococcus coleopterorum]
MSKKDELLDILRQESQQEFTAVELAELTNLDRSNVSRYLNELHKEGSVAKNDGRPVKYSLVLGTSLDIPITFDNLIGKDGSLDAQIKKAKAAMLYPPRGLHTIIFGETGTGKTMFAECMYRFAVDSEILKPDAPFITFNCADYAQNPQLLFAHVFGVKKGAFTGADETRQGLVAQADSGILFLDEIHRLPPEGQEMLFTFIDKGTYRPLGASNEESASVQIIGATTENSATFLATFNRRIPMQIEMPSLSDRGLDERLAIIQDFLQQETNRLRHDIEIDQRSLLAFMLYQPEGNIGQLKRDLKLVCAKAFLNYHTADHSNGLLIKEDSLPIQVQKGLLRTNEMIDQISPLIDNKHISLHFQPGKKEVAWAQDPQQDMEVYNSISYKLDKLGRADVDTVIDLNDIISRDLDRYFETYVDELYQPTAYQELITEELWQLVNSLYESAESHLNRQYDEKVRFAFALHVTSMIERLGRDEKIEHPNLNDIRRQYAEEFHEALDWSMQIEQKFGVMVPLDEIGFITMFLTNEISENKEVKNRQVEVVVIMHGNSTASSMLETCQDLLGIQHGTAFNMPLTMKTEDMYQQFSQHVKHLKEEFSEGILLLTDMGSPGDFGRLIEKELGVATRVITMASTMVVLESLRLASMGRHLEDVHESVQKSFLNIVQPIPEEPLANKEKVIVVACFTGEGVAKKLKTAVSNLITPGEYEILEMQFLERESFKARINQVLATKEIVAIIGTVEIHHKNIPFIPAMDVFNKESLVFVQDTIEEKLSADEISLGLSSEFSSVSEAKRIFKSIEDSLNRLRGEKGLVVPSSVSQGMMMHLGFLIKDKYEGRDDSAEFENLQEFMTKEAEMFEVVEEELRSLGTKLSVTFSNAEIAYIVYMFKKNLIDVF